jgi:hypothetical protein
VAEIKGSRELGGSQGESPKLGCSKSRVAKSRGARIAVGSRSREDRWIRNPIAFRAFGGSEVERSCFRHQKSRSAESRGTSVDTWQNHKVGPGNRQVDTRHLVEGVNTLLTSRISGIREVRARRVRL